MVGNIEQPEPERAQGGQHTSLVGDAGGQDPVKCADAIGGDEKQAIAQVINVANLSLAPGNTLETCFPQCHATRPLTQRAFISTFGSTLNKSRSTGK